MLTQSSQERCILKNRVPDIIAPVEKRHTSAARMALSLRLLGDRSRPRRGVCLREKYNGVFHGASCAAAWAKRSHATVASQCPLWVKSRHLQCNRPCPLYPRKQTCAVQLGMSALGQKPTSAIRSRDLANQPFQRASIAGRAILLLFTARSLKLFEGHKKTRAWIADGFGTDRPA